MQNKKEDFIDIGLRIKQARERNSLTQETFAEKIGVTPQYISDLERAVVGISIPTLIKICMILGCSSDYILFGKGNEQDLGDIKTKLSYLSEEQYKATEQAINLLADAMINISNNYDSNNNNINNNNE